jgi:hypothetical protein
MEANLTLKLMSGGLKIGRVIVWCVLRLKAMVSIDFLLRKTVWTRVLRERKGEGGKSYKEEKNETKLNFISCCNL